jgi:hypothetical protein
MASKNIKLVTYAGSTVTPQDDALIHETAIPKSGIIYGGKTTKKTNNTLHIAAGHGIVCGRKFTISECDVPVQLTGGASHNGRVYIHMDLSNSTNPIQILIETGTQLSSEIQQKDVNILNGVYEFNLATFMVDATTIYNVVDVFPVVSGKDMSELEKTFVKKRDILKTMEEVSANKDADKVVGPEVVKELSNDLGGCSFEQEGGNFYIVGADSVRKKLDSSGIAYLGEMPYTCTQDYGECTLLTFCRQKSATQNVTIKNLNGSYNIRQIIPAHIGGILCFLAIVDVTNLNSGATIDTDSSDTKRVFIIQ